MVDENLREAMRVLARASQSGEVRDYPGLAIASAGVDFPTFNAALLSAPVADATELGRRVTLAAVHFGARRLPWSLWACVDWLGSALQPALPAALARAGLGTAAELTGMIADVLVPPSRDLPELDCRNAADEPTRRAFAQILSAVFGVPLALACDIYGGDRLWRNGLAGCVGFVNGRPVATAATLIAADAVGVYSVATLPEHRRRGYGEAITRLALGRACQASGLRRRVLQASDSGLPLYQRMGFRAVTRFVIGSSG